MGGGMSIEMWLAEDDDSVKEHDLQQRVFDELAAEPGLDVKDIRVIVHERVVTLSGGVQRYADKIAAGRVAWAVPGVQALRNGLAVLRRAGEGPMKRWPSIIAALCAAGITLAAQQGRPPLPAVKGSVAQVSSPSVPLAGPRLTPEWPRFEMTVVNGDGATRPLLASASNDHTIVISTLGLAVIALIVVLLVL